MKVHITRHAKADLLSIGEYIERDSPIRAASFVDELEAACLQIGQMPLAFPSITRHAKIRRRVYGSYLILYTITDRIEILHVIHGARDVNSILFPRKN